MDENAHVVLSILENGSIAKAAQSLHISQPALSKRLKTIETALGASLFDRSLRPLEPTMAGKVYIDYARRVIDAESSMLKTIGSIKHGSLRHLSVGVSASRVDEYLTDVIARFRSVNPECVLHIVPVENIEHLNSLLIEERVEFAAMTPVVPDRHMFDVEQLCEEHIQVMAPSTMVIATIQRDATNIGDAPLVEPKALAGLPFIMPPSNWPIGAIFKAVMDNAGVRLNVAMHVCTVNLMYEMVRRGLGVSLTTNTSRVVHADPNIKCYDLVGLEGKEGLILAHRRHWNPSADARMFINLLREYLTSLKIK